MPGNKGAKAYIAREFRFFWIGIPFLIFSGVLGFIYFPMVFAVLSAVFIVIVLILGFLTALNFKRSVEQRQLSEGRHSGIINNLQDSIIVYDKDFKVLIFNPSAERLFGLSVGEVVGQSFPPDRIKEEKYAVLVQTIFPSLAPIVYKRSEPGAYPQVADVSFSEPKRDLRIITTPIYLEGENIGFVKVVADRTKEIEVHRSKSEFISTAAHQLRTPLSAVIWALQILNKEESVSAEGKEAAREGLLAGEKLSKVVTDLLDVSKIEEGKLGYDLKKVDIAKFLEDMLANIKDFITGSKLKLKLYFKNEIAEPLMLMIDTDRLGMALSNILDNAIKYNLENGSITVYLRKLVDKPYVQIIVEDTGIGIKKEDLDKLFTKFFRSEEAVRVQAEGSGLGLYIARSIARRHGGDVRVESDFGRGTRVSLTLPIDPKFVPSREFIYQEY